eukprot:1224386-Lingulodinium_polyedra.AAC.1
MNGTLYKSKLLQHKCLNFFDKDQGPNFIKQWKGKAEKFQILAASISVAMKKEAEGTKRHFEELQEYHTPTKELNQERTKKARLALEARKEKSELMRLATWQE